MSTGDRRPLRRKKAPKCHAFGIRPIYKNAKIIDFERCPKCFVDLEVNKRVLSHRRAWFLEDTTRLLQKESDEDFRSKDEYI